MTGVNTKSKFDLNFQTKFDLNFQTKFSGIFKADGGEFEDFGFEGMSKFGFKLLTGLKNLVSKVLHSKLKVTNCILL